mmetsp:Transcript_50959/g.124162  ORF Transcript_50959/g.124162 Transcript_50959/m.124162 type:complete len:232 (-) Transcript_50959:963-1658(-)
MPAGHPWVVLERRRGVLGAVDAQCLTVALHARGRVDRVPKEAVPRIALAHDVGHNGARVEADTNVDGALGEVLLVDWHLASSGDDVEGEEGDSLRVVVLVLDQVCHSHPSVTNRLDLEDLVVLGEGIEHCVQAVKHVCNLLRGQGRADVREADDIREEDGDGVLVLWLHLLPREELLDNVLREHIRQEACVLFLVLPVLFEREDVRVDVPRLHPPQLLVDVLHRRPLLGNL